MTNQLIKDTRVTYTPGSPGVAASPGQPYQPAYTAFEPQTVCGYVTTGGTWQWVLDDQGNYQYVLTPNAGSSVASSYYACTTQQVPVYHAAVPYVAPTAGVAATSASTAYDFNLGWNSGARSQGFFAGDGYISFMVSPSLVGAVAGLNYTDPDADYVNIDYAFYLSNNITRIVESGAEKLYVGPFVATDTFKITRVSGTVRYYINDVLEYTSATPSSGITFLDVSLYSGGDYLDSPAIAPYTSVGSGSTVGVARDGTTYITTADALNMQPMAMSAGSANHGYASLTLRPLTMSSSLETPTQASGALVLEPLGMTGGTFISGIVGSTTTRADLTLSPMTMSSNPYQGGTLNLLPMTVKGSNYGYGEAALSFEAMTLDSRTASMVPSYALANLPMVGLTMSGRCLTGQIGGGAQTAEPMSMLAGRSGYGEARMTMAAPAMYASAYEGNTNASMRELVLSTSRLSYYGYVDVRLFSDVTAGDEYLTLVLKNAAMSESASVTDAMSYSAILQALMNTRVDVFAGIPTLTQDGEVWVVNDATGASTSYENYGFNSFGTYHGKYLGARADGVYLLEGDTDAGAPIRSSISIGKQDFGTTALKAVANCYVGIASDGNVYLKVIADGASYLYKTNRNSEVMKTQRVATGLGIRASHITFELYNEAGADFELASVEFEAAVLSRRI